MSSCCNNESFGCSEDLSQRQRLTDRFSTIIVLMKCRITLRMLCRSLRSSSSVCPWQKPSQLSAKQRFATWLLFPIVLPNSSGLLLLATGCDSASSGGADEELRNWTCKAGRAEGRMADVAGLESERPAVMWAFH